MQDYVELETAIAAEWNVFRFWKILLHVNNLKFPVGELLSINFDVLYYVINEKQSPLTMTCLIKTISCAFRNGSVYFSLLTNDMYQLNCDINGNIFLSVYVAF